MRKDPTASHGELLAQMCEANEKLVLATLHADELRAEANAAKQAIEESLAERTRLEAKLALADRLAALGTLAAGVAHEINNPLAFVSANVWAAIEALERVHAPNAETARVLEDVLAGLRDATVGTARVARIVEQLKGLTRPRDGARERASVLAAAEAAAKTTAMEVARSARLVIDVPEGLEVVADVERLTQVLVNLIGNAAQAMPAGVALDEISVTARASGPRVVITVRDSGPGMSRELQKRIFEPFFSTKAPGQGMGLGLALVRGIVASFDGTVEVRSEEGLGTTVDVTLHAAPARVPHAVTTPQVPSALPGCRVLYIDDEPYLLRAVQRMLRSRHTVQTVDTAEAALDLLLVEGEPPFDVILCDVIMPGMDGPALYERLRAVRPMLASRMLFVTGGSTTEAAGASSLP